MRASITEAGKEMREMMGSKAGVMAGRTQEEEKRRQEQIKKEADAYFKNEENKAEEAAKEEVKEEKVKYVAFSDDDK